MIASQTILNIIKYRKSKVFVLYKGKEEKEREIEEIHGWWDKGFLTPEEVDYYTLERLTFQDLQNAVAERMDGDYYADYIIEYSNYLTTDDFYDYDDYLNDPFNVLGTLSENEYWNGYYREDPESEDPEDPDYIWQRGTYYYLLIIRNGLWTEYGEIHVPW